MWGSQTYGMAPDILTSAKALTSAYMPLSAVMVNEAIYQACVAESAKIGTFGHGYTYSGHPVACAVALETLRIYEERDIVGRVRDLAPMFQAGLRRFKDHPLVGEVRGVGLIGAVELVADKASRRPFDPTLAVGAKLVGFSHGHGAILRPIGDSIGFSPPLVISEGEVEDLLARFGRALEDTTDWLVREGHWSA
jgi:4-aminobutyrate--pyruvate transaminase